GLHGVSKFLSVVIPRFPDSTPIKEYSKEIGCSEMFLITDKGNPRACHVYEKLGGKNDYKDEIVYVYDYEKGDK
ncbi:MAG: GNAT family N-acetyltransferase, partial [Clostridia bacterium]